ncbi:hypothetical protein Ancab_014343 [Ancistrocladus abbreviatus]
MSQTWSYSPPPAVLPRPQGFSGEEKLSECREHHWLMSAGEFEAAEVLVSFAKSVAVRESSGGGGGGGESADSWRSKGKRMSKRVKNESAPVDPALKSQKSLPKLFDLNEVQTISQEESEKGFEDRNAKLLTAEDDAESGAGGPVCTTSLGGGKSRRNMTEAEKEARRLRRIMANRESARQTIRRRQAIYEELTRKAADLAWENANLKRDKELIVKEYQSIQSVNKNLKEKMAKALGLEAQVNHEAATNISSPSFVNYPFYTCAETLFAPFAWPSTIETSRFNLSQVGPCGIAVSSSVKVPANATNPFTHLQEICSSSRTPSIPWRMVPCPWLLPIPNDKHSHHQLPSPHINDEKNQSSWESKHVANPSLHAVPHGEDRSLILPLNVKVEASTSTESTFEKNVGEVPLGFCPNSGFQPVRCRSKVAGSSANSVGCARARIPFKNGNGVDVVLSQSVHHHLRPNINHGKKLVDSAAAAEARKRRKELIKWKNLHNCESSIHC